MGCVVYVGVLSRTFHGSEPHPAMFRFSLDIPTVRFGSRFSYPMVRSGLVRQFGLVWFVLVCFGSVRFGSVRSGSVPCIQAFVRIGSVRNRRLDVPTDRSGSRSNPLDCGSSTAG